MHSRFVSVEEESSLAGKKGSILRSRLLRPKNTLSSITDGEQSGDDGEGDDGSALIADEFNQNTSMRRLSVGSYIN